MKKIFFLILLFSLGVSVGFAQAANTRFAIVGLDHDHVWGRMDTLLKTPNAELVAIADTHPELIAKAKTQVPAGVKFFSDYTEMLDRMKPDAVIVTTANNLHLPILRACARRHRGAVGLAGMAGEHGRQLLPPARPDSARPAAREPLVGADA